MQPREHSPAGDALEAVRQRLCAAGLLDGSVPLHAHQIAGGYSNVTSELRGGDVRLVMRRPPPGDLAAHAHDMRREFTVLGALHPTTVPVPRPLLYCDDVDVVGSPFYVMEHVDGRVVRNADAASQLSETERRACGEALVDMLAQIHGVDVEAAGLASFGRPDGFVERQLARWGGQLDTMPTRDPAGFAELRRRLLASCPATSRSALLHGDFRLDNVMLDRLDAGRIVAVLDWEMSTLGDPLVDLGLLLLHWNAPDETPITDVQMAMSLPGFPSRSDVVRRYADRTGVDVDGIDFFVVLAHFKMAVIAEGIYNRMRSGNAPGPGFEHIVDVAPRLLAAGLRLSGG